MLGRLYNAVKAIAIFSLTSSQASFSLADGLDIRSEAGRLKYLMSLIETKVSLKDQRPFTSTTNLETLEFVYRGMENVYFYPEYKTETICMRL